MSLIFHTTDGGVSVEEWVPRIRVSRGWLAAAQGDLVRSDGTTITITASNGVGTYKYECDDPQDSTAIFAKLVGVQQ